MFRSRLTKKKAGVLTLAVLLLLGGGAAFAYWTTSGTGSGTAATGSVAGVTVNQTSTISGMAPGDSAQTLSGNFTNTNAGPVYITTVTVSIASVTKDTAAPAGTCDSTDYTLANASMSVGAQVPAGTAQGSWTGATIKFNNKAGVNQNPCKNATVNLSYVAA